MCMAQAQIAIASPHHCLCFFSSYIVPVLLLSVALNIPKYFEAKFILTPVAPPDGGNGTSNGTMSANATADACDGDGETECKIDFDVTDLRNDENYIRIYINWTVLITTGLIPMSTLIYFNFSIFRGQFLIWVLAHV